MNYLMKKAASIILTIMLITCAVVQAQTMSQQLVSSAGDTYKNATYQLDWSMGEIQIETYSNGIVLLTQGFHQGSITVTAIMQTTEQQFQISVFPNPASTTLYYEVMPENEPNMVIALYNSLGQKVWGKSYTGNSNLITDEIPVDKVAREFICLR